MDAKIENLQNALKYVKTFYAELSQMLTDADEMINKAGWTVLGQNSVFDGLSRCLDMPNEWAPPYVFRNYTQKNSKGYVKGIIVYFDEYQGINFPPSIICGIVRELPEPRDRNGLWWLWKRNIESLEKYPTDIVQLEAQTDDRKLSGKLFITPLSDIRNKTDLKKLIDKLISMELD